LDVHAGPSEQGFESVRARVDLLWACVGICCGLPLRDLDSGLSGTNVR
jgi:hypothetical protein